MAIRHFSGRAGSFFAARGRGYTYTIEYPAQDLKQQSVLLLLFFVRQMYFIFSREEQFEWELGRLPRQ
jgi:hypothetical protein